jgi:putative transcriptional regulator
MYNFNGKMLLSMPTIGSKIFQNTVIYIHTDNDSGSLGFITNFQMEQSQAKEWSEEIGWHYPQRIYHGGPDADHVGFVLHSNDYMQTTTVRLNDKISYTAGKSILDDIDRGIGPLDVALNVGYCSWEPGQLLKEVERGDWRVTDYDDEFFFATHGRKIDGWEYAISVDANNFVKRLNHELTLLK